ncbi:unnamed protein product, partial [Closterium sp. Yama58-4]
MRLLTRPHCHDCRNRPRRHCQQRLQRTRVAVIAASLVALCASFPPAATVRADVIQPLPGLGTANDVALAEKAALLSLAAALGDHAAFRWAGWANQSQGLSYEQSKPCVQFWEFLSCDSHGRVSSINIANPTLAVINASWANQKTPGGLKGSIPWDTLTALEHLQAVDLSGNSISGPPFTAAISKFTALRDIQLARNALDAPLVGELSALSNLHNLDLSGNRIPGALPPGLFALTALEVLSLASNQLADSFPSGLSALTALKHLELGSNSFSGPCLAAGALSPTCTCSTWPVRECSPHRQTHGRRSHHSRSSPCRTTTSLRPSPPSCCNCPTSPT